eukprot:jgi/Tetstr1/420649/TSEL_011737.t1
MPRKAMPIRELFFNTGECSAGSAVPIWACRRCGWKLVDNATRFARHALRCPSTQPGDRELAHAHLGSLSGTSAAQLEAISITADEFGRAFTLEGKAHVRNLFEDTNASRSGEKAKLFRCKRCGHETTENATRFAQHILKCESATDDDKTIAQPGLQIHSAVPGEVWHDVIDMDAFDCFVDEGFEAELARLPPTSTEVLSINRIPAGAEGDATPGTLATAPSPLRQGSGALRSPSLIGRGNNGFLPDTFAHEETGDFEDIQDLLSTLDLVTTSCATEPEPANNVIAPIVFQKRRRDNNGERVPAETVSISVDEYQQWKQWKAQMSMPKIIQVPDMEYSMFQNLHSFYMGYAMNCANAYLSHGGFNGPSCNSEMIGQAISGEQAECPERITSIYNSAIALAQDCVDTGIAGALQKWSLIPRLDDNQNAVYKGLEKAFQHMTIDDNGARHAPDPKTEGTLLELQQFTCKYGPYLRNLYLNNSNSLTGRSSSFAEQPLFGSGPSVLTSGSTPSNALGISEGAFTSWHKQASECTPLMDGISSDMRCEIDMDSGPPRTAYACSGLPAVPIFWG